MLVLKVLGHAAFEYSGTCRETSINVSGGRMENNNAAAVRSISACMSSACYESIAQRRLQLSRVEQDAIHQNTRGGTRTRNLLLRREAPYPLGHTSNWWCSGSCCLALISASMTQAMGHPVVESPFAIRAHGQQLLNKWCFSVWRTRSVDFAQSLMAALYITSGRGHWTQPGDGVQLQDTSCSIWDYYLVDWLCVRSIYLQSCLGLTCGTDTWACGQHIFWLAATVRLIFLFVKWRRFHSVRWNLHLLLHVSDERTIAYAGCGTIIHWITKLPWGWTFYFRRSWEHAFQRPASEAAVLVHPCCYLALVVGVAIAKTNARVNK